MTRSSPPRRPRRFPSSSGDVQTPRSGARAGSVTAGWASGRRPGVSPTPSRWRQTRPPARAAGRPPGLSPPAVAMGADEPARTARPDPPARHGMQVWCGLADSRQAARACLAPAMQAFYQLPFERFERYCPYATADDVAEFLTPYLDAGCTEFNLIPQSPDHGQAVAGTAAVKRLLART